METIVIVDDDEAHGQTVCSVLEHRFQVHLRETAESALELIAEIGDLYAVISDLDLPGMDGAALLEILKFERADVRRVLMSAQFSDPHFKPESVAHAEAHMLLAKPFSAKELRNAV